MPLSNSCLKFIYLLAYISKDALVHCNLPLMLFIAVVVLSANAFQIHCFSAAYIYDRL